MNYKPQNTIQDMYLRPYTFQNQSATLRETVAVSQFCLLSIREFYVSPRRWHSDAETYVDDTYHELCFVIFNLLYFLCAFVDQ